MIMVRAKVMFNWDPILVVGSLKIAYVGPTSAEAPLDNQSCNEWIWSYFAIQG